MAFRLPEFQRISFDEANPFLRGISAGQEPFSNLLQQRLAELQAQKQKAELPYAGDLEKQKLQKTIYENLIQKPYADNADAFGRAALLQAQAQPAHMQAETGLLGQQTLAEKIANQFLPEKLRLANQYQQLQNQLYPAKTQAMIDYQKMGGGRASAGTKDEAIYQQKVAQYNPELASDPQKFSQAIDAISRGKNTLPNGQPINVNSDIQRAYDRAYKSTTTSSLITASNKANQAEAEMPVIDKAIREGRAPYSQTIMGYSPDLAKDMMKPNDPVAQTRIGKSIAADLLNFDKAALQTRIAGTESGVTIIDEIMKKSRQSINSNYPFLTQKARDVALDMVNETLRGMLKARNKYGIGAGRATQTQDESNVEPTSQGKVRNYNISTGQFE